MKFIIDRDLLKYQATIAVGSTIGLSVVMAILYLRSIV